MRCICKLWAAVLALVLCLMLASCMFSPPEQSEEKNTTDAAPTLTTPEETTPAETTAAETTTAETTTATPEPDFSNTPEPDGTKRY